MIDLEPLYLTFQLALTTTLLLLVIGVPLGAWLSSTKSRWRPFWEALISMPIVLPPTVLGFYLLLTFSPASMIGGWLDRHLNVSFIFSFEGLVLASMIYSLPFMVHPIQSGLKGLPSSMKEASYMLGKSKWTTLLKVLLPNIKTSILTGLVLTFAHTVGEFGLVLMIGGSIPGVTKVASIAIYEEVESMNYAAAHLYAMVLFGLTFLILFTVFILNKRKRILT